ncbi:MAG: large conductance mechanosensitive channel protein MscL [Thermomicrobiales bacterium]
MFKEFRDFIMRGNVVELAVAVIMGAAFGKIVTSVVEDIITPLIGAAGGQPDFSTIKAGPILIGNFINAVVGFLIIALVVFLLIVKPMNSLMARMKKQEEVAPPAPTVDQKLLTEIRDLLKDPAPR